LVATTDHAGGDEQADEREIDQRQHPEASGQHEQQHGPEQAGAEVLDQVAPSQPVMPCPTPAIGCRFRPPRSPRSPRRP